MKKILLLAPVILLLVTGCGEKKGTIICTLEANYAAQGYETTAEYKINYKGEVVQSVDTIEVIASDSDQVLDYLKSIVERTYQEASKNYGGYNYEVKKDGKKITSKVTIDYDKMNLDKFAKDNSSVAKYVVDGKFTVEGAKAIYESLGAKCED